MPSLGVLMTNIMTNSMQVNNPTKCVALCFAVVVLLLISKQINSFSLLMF